MLASSTAMNGMTRVSLEHLHSCQGLLKSGIEFNRNHNLHWGRLVSPDDVKIEWHSKFDRSSKFRYVLIMSQLRRRKRLTSSSRFLRELALPPWIRLNISSSPLAIGIALTGTTSAGECARLTSTLRQADGPHSYLHAVRSVWGGHRGPLKQGTSELDRKPAPSPKAGQAIAKARSVL